MKPALNYKALVLMAVGFGIVVLIILHNSAKPLPRPQIKSHNTSELPLLDSRKTTAGAIYKPTTKTPMIERNIGKGDAKKTSLVEWAANTDSEVPVRRGPLDPNVETFLDGKRMPHQEAIPIIKNYLQGADKGKILAAVGALCLCNDKVVDEDIIQRVLALYEKTPTHLIPNSASSISEEVGYDMDLKIAILLVMDKCGGRHRDVFLSNAARDPNPSIRWHAEALIKGESLAR